MPKTERQHLGCSIALSAEKPKHTVRGKSVWFAFHTPKVASPALPVPSEVLCLVTRELYLAGHTIK